MNEQSLKPRSKGGCGTTCIEQITGIHTMSRSAGASFHAGNCQSQIRLTLCPIQNAEGFAAKLGRFESVLRFRVIAGRGPGLRHMQDSPLCSNTDPEMMIE